jgi:hypothetical protein
MRHEDVELLGAVLQGVIRLMIGTFITLIGFRVVGKRPGESERYDRWHHRFGLILKLVGPLMAAFGIFEILCLLLRSS